MSRKVTDYFPSYQQVKKCKVNDESIKSKAAPTVLCETNLAEKSSHIGRCCENLPECWDMNKKMNSAKNTNG